MSTLKIIFVPVAVFVAVLWIGWDASVRIYEAYEALCSPAGCARSIASDVVLLRVLVFVAAFGLAYGAHAIMTSNKA